LFERRSEGNNQLEIILVLVAGLRSGFINTLASSGSAITLPLLIFLGLPANVANGTNRVSILAGSCAAILALQKEKVIDWKKGLLIAIPVSFGVFIGAKLASVMSAKSMEWAIIAAVVMALIVILSNPKRILKEKPNRSPSLNWFKIGIFVLVGIWAGFIVLDSATYMLLVLVLGVGYDLIKANALKNLLLFPIALVSILVFSAGAEIDWRLGSMLAVGSIVGSWSGGLLVAKEWIKVWVFRLLVVTIIGEIIQLLLKHHAIHLR
jgi:uncharacterized membrane protein YfcA